MLNETNYYDVLIRRMEKLIIQLDRSQGTTRIPVGADMYWYIQKVQELKLLKEGVFARNNHALENHLDQLCSYIQLKLTTDEQKIDHRKSA